MVPNRFQIADRTETELMKTDLMNQKVNRYQILRFFFYEINRYHDGLII